MSNDERSKMGAGPRDIAIEQFQKSENPITVSAANVGGNSRLTDKQFNISFNHSVKMLAFSVKNENNATVYHIVEDGCIQEFWTYKEAKEYLDAVNNHFDAHVQHLLAKFE